MGENRVMKNDLDHSWVTSVGSRRLNLSAVDNRYGKDRRLRFERHQEGSLLEWPELAITAAGTLGKGDERISLFQESHGTVNAGFCAGRVRTVDRNEPDLLEEHRKNGNAHHFFFYHGPKIAWYRVQEYGAVKVSLMVGDEKVVLPGTNFLPTFHLHSAAARPSRRSNTEMSRSINERCISGRNGP